MVGQEHQGVTSVVRELMIKENHYESILHFFHASSWEVRVLMKKWIHIVNNNAPLVLVGGYKILAGDGVKQPKEAKKMPGVKKLHQESENVSKAEYIFGHMFGAVGVLAERAEKIFCIPLGASIQDGVKTIKGWNNVADSQLSHVEQVIHLAGKCAEEMGKSIITLDRLFLSVNALKARKEYINEIGEELLHIVTKAKRSIIAYKEPELYSGRGRRPIKGEGVKLWNLFEEKHNEYQEFELRIYNETKRVSCYTIDLLWGQKFYQKLRFILVDMDGSKNILVSTLLDLSAVDIIRIYSWRFKIEVQFKELKHTLGGFAYHFWSKHMPKLKRFAPAKTDLVKDLCDEHKKELITNTLKAIEGYVMFAIIALGMLQLIALKFADKIETSGCLWLRTKTNEIPSESTVIRFLSKNIFRVLGKQGVSGIYQLIQSKQEQQVLEEFPEAS